RVSQVIDAMLAFARAGARPDPGARADLATVIATVIDEARPAAVERRIELRSEEFTGRIEVGCRPGILSSAVSNLVENASKYMGEAAERKVIIRVEERRSSAVIRVEDTGPGIAPKIRETIFEPYARAADPKVPGIGLGLATVKRLSEAHGGRVGVYPRRGGGSI